MAGERWACVYMCMCVCIRERDYTREKERKDNGVKWTKKKLDLKTDLIDTINSVQHILRDGGMIRRCAKIITNCTDEIWPGQVGESAVCQGLLMLDCRYGQTAHLLKKTFSKPFNTCRLCAENMHNNHLQV